MKLLSQNEMYAISGANDEEAYNSGIYATVTGVSTAIGTSIGGPIGAAVGAGLGTVVGHLIVNHKEEVLHGLGQAAETVVTNYAHGHKDAMFTGMPMAFQ